MCGEKAKTTESSRVKQRAFELILNLSILDHGLSSWIVDKAMRQHALFGRSYCGISAPQIVTTVESSALDLSLRPVFRAVTAGQ